MIAPISRIAIGLGLVVLLISARPAVADDIRIAIYVEGPAKDKVRTAIVSTLPGGTVGADASHAIKKALPLKRAFRGSSRKLSLVLKQSARQVDAKVIVVALAEKATVKLLVVDASGEVLAERSVSISPRRPKTDELEAAISAVLGPVWSRRFSGDAKPSTAGPAISAAAVASAGPAASASPAGPSASATQGPSLATPAHDSESAVERQLAGPISSGFWHRWNQSLINVTAELGSTGRFFSYNDKRTPGLATYEQPVAPILGLAIEAYPGARRGPFVHGLGGYGRFWVSFDSKAAAIPDMTTLRNRSSEIEGGLRYRTPLGRSYLGISLGAGKLSSRFDDAERVSPTVLIPQVSYTYLRPGLDLRIPLSRFAVLINTGYRHLFTSGGIHEAFVHLSVQGVDVGAGVAMAVSRSVSLNLAASYVRLFYDLKPNPGDPFIAGGALDQYYNASVCGSYAY